MSAVVDLLDLTRASGRSDFQVLALLSRKKIPLAIIANTGTVEEQYPMPLSPHRSKMKTLIEDRGLRPADLVPIFGSRNRISELLSGKRPPGKAQAKALAEFFRLPVELFIIKTRRVSRQMKLMGL